MKTSILATATIAVAISCWYSIHHVPTQTIHLSSPPHLDRNNRLIIDPWTNQSTLELIGTGQLTGPESIGFHPTDDTLITGCYDGSIKEVRSIDGPVDKMIINTLTYTGLAANHQSMNQSSLSAHCHNNRNDPWTCGRPLGVEYLDNDHLLIADAYHGLLEYTLNDPTHNRSFRVLWNDTMCDTNSVTVVKSIKQSNNQSDDWIYFTSASCLYRNNVVVRNAVSGTCTGSLRRVLVDGSINQLLVDKLCFANGVIPLYDHSSQSNKQSINQSHQPNNYSIVVGITDRAQIMSYDPISRTHTIVADNLPCMPDNLHIDTRNGSRYWFGCGGPLRHDNAFSMFDWLADKPTIRSIILTFVPYWMLRMFAKHEGMIVHMEKMNSTHHRIIDTLQDITGQLKVVTSAAEHGEYIWMTSYLPEVNYLARIKT